MRWTYSTYHTSWHSLFSINANYYYYLGPTNQGVGRHTLHVYLHVHDAKPEKKK